MGNYKSLPHLIENKKRLCIWVLGGPCSGRTTQCKLLSEQFQLAHISPEVIVRACLLQEEIRKRETRIDRLSQKRLFTYDAINSRERKIQEEKQSSIDVHPKTLIHSTPSSFSQQQLFALRNSTDSDDDNIGCPNLTKELIQSMRRGTAINPAIITILVKETMDAAKKTCNGFLIDGYPRNLEQAELFYQKIGEPHVLLYLESPENVLKDRILSRAKLTQRFDDNQFTIRCKFANFNNNTLPLISHWLLKLSVGPISANMEIDEVTKRCSEIIQRAFGSNFKFAKKPKRYKKSTIISGARTAGSNQSH